MSESGKIPSSFNHNETEDKWIKKWEESGVFRWDSAGSRDNTFVVDTPPPTVSGSLHMGHVFGYTQADVIVRYQRMQGKNIFYPMGWDDNGLPTERRVQNYYNIRCDAKLPYQKDWQPKMAEKDSKEIQNVSRKNFIEACAILTKEDEEAFERVWRRLALSLDWSLQYATIDDHCRKVSQISFLDLVKKGKAYSAEAPVMWDTDFKSAVAQAEIEDKEIPGAYHDIRFKLEDGSQEFVISTTRPELLAACIAVVAHPDDERYKKLFGKNAITPLFHANVPIMPSEHADPEKGSGILMICTFGDINDVNWWKKSGLPTRQIMGLDGRILDIKFPEGSFKSLNPDEANKNFSQLVGLYIKQAQKKTVELLKTEGALIGEPKAITHAVKFYEKGDRPLEFVTSRQWFIRLLDHKEELLSQGKKIVWHPEHMQSRYQNWVEGLNSDWCISRQRFFGVSFPVWYPVKDNGSIDYEKPIFAKEGDLPVDPLSEPAPGYNESQRDKPGGFSGDLDVMDTWATSSLTPQIQSYWGLDNTRHKKLFPMDLRPQGHDIIRTWAFYTVVKAYFHEGEIPWKHISLNGWILDPDRKKMSKSKGNVVTPEDLVKENSADAIRYWASRARLGVDTAFDASLFKIGGKLVTKLFNASKFVISQFERVNKDIGQFNTADIKEPLDTALVEKLCKVISECTKSFENFEYAQSLQTAEETFWHFCDHYLELVKVRSYSEEDSEARKSALATLSWSINTFLRLFAPFIPYITEEIWSWSFGKNSKEFSIHKSSWPKIEEVGAVKNRADSKTYDAAIEVISKIRAKKTESQKNLKWPVEKLIVKGKASNLESLKLCLNDVISAGTVKTHDLVADEAIGSTESLFNIEVTLSTA
jgi:valyl-tRNA synthetase